MSSSAGTKTKKVTTYGKRTTRIVSLFRDLTPEKENDTPVRHIPTPVKPAGRPVLASKASIDNVQTVASKEAVNIKGKGKMPKSVVTATIIDPDSSSDPVEISPPYRFKPIQRPPRARQISRIILSPSSPSPAASSPLSTGSNESASEYQPSSPLRRSMGQGRMVLDSVELPSRPKRVNRATPRRAYREVSEDVGEAFSRLDIRSSVEAGTSTPRDLASLPATAPQGLAALAAVCDSPTVLGFSAVLSALGSLMLHSPPGQSLQITKAGEATYSEVFSISHGQSTPIIMKIIPLEIAGTGREGIETPDLSDPASVAKEIAITRRISQIGTGMVQFKAAYMVQGAYTSLLLSQWDSYKRKWGSENIRPSCYGKDQRYVVFCLADGGFDLESFTFDSKLGWCEAAGVFWQTADALARAEEAAEFEHRDLHEGQILIEHFESSTKSATIDYSSPAKTGIQVTLIDFGLSRMTCDAGDVVYTSLPNDIMDGEGAQWDVYREMKDAANGDWATYRPVTNVMWLRYILSYILNKLPSLKSLKTASRRGISAKDVARCHDAYSALMQTMEALEADHAQRRKGRGTRGGKTAFAGPTFADAQSLVGWARERGWVV